MLKCLTIGAFLLLAGCAADPMERAGTWRAHDVNRQNLDAMLAEPSHAVRGIGATDSRADAAAAAVQRLREGKSYPLLDPRGSGGTTSVSQ
jgi:uncharacterized lipoprotein YajG